MVRGLVDTGCTTTVISSRLVVGCKGKSCITAFDGRELQCREPSWVEMEVDGVFVKVKAIVTDSIIEDVDVVMGMDAINQLGGVTVGQGKSSLALLNAY